MAKKKSKAAEVKELVKELNDLFLREGTEMAERGIYQRIMAQPEVLGGSVDKSVEQLSRMKALIIALKELV